MKLFLNNKIYSEFEYEKEIDFEREVVANSKLFFGANSIYIDTKKKIGAKALGNTIPDGFLFDLSDKDSPEFYLVEVELAKHDFYNHIFPQITKFFGFYKNPKSQNELVGKIHTMISSDEYLKKEFKRLIGDSELYKFIKDTIESSQNILIVIDGDKKEMPEIIETYTDTWGKMVKHILIKKFSNNGESIFTMHPEFETLVYGGIEEEYVDESEDKVDRIPFTEESHMEGVSETVKEIYSKIKTEIQQANPDVVFNPQKFYISIRKDRNIAFFKFRKNKIALVVLNPLNNTTKVILNHQVKNLSLGVQKFWNGPSCAIMIYTTNHLDEIISLLIKMVNSKQIPMLPEES